VNAPDVTVIVAVYNTMPYLTTCLTSLVEQTIGRDRMEIIAVDDGSTDGSSAELDRFAQRYPDTVKVLHQPNSGGPAVPSNRALTQATGRYVFFVGADDHLGLEALERLVTAADRYDADVTLGRLVGVNGRYVHQAIYAANNPDVDLFDSAMPWSLSNTKLFRRELIERYALRYPEDMPMLSDQPFTIEACVRAGRISVLADYEFYFAVRRLDASNITFRPRHEVLLHCTGRLMDHVAGLVEPGKQREALHLRHFSWEVAKLLRPDLLRLDRSVQERIHAGVRSLTGRYLTDNIRDQLTVYKRVLLGLADRPDLDALLAFIEHDTKRIDPAVVVEGDRWYAAYPGFRAGLPDAWFDITAVAADWAARMDATGIAWEFDADGARVLSITGRSALPHLAECADTIGMTAGEIAGHTVAATSDGDGTTVRVRFTVDQLLAGRPERASRRHVRVGLTVGGQQGSAALRTPRAPGVRRMIFRRGTRFYAVMPAKSHTGRLVISVTPVTLGRVVGRVRRKLTQGGRR
jgi:glycosyltransferase involved in cell wall biosynthesis